MGFWNVFFTIMYFLSCAIFIFLTIKTWRIEKEKNKVIEKLIKFIRENDIKIDVSELKSFID